jgi:hypothetical protein
MALTSTFGTSANGPATSGASGWLMPAAGVDNTNNNADILVMAPSDAWHAVEDCWHMEAE